jgi:hypothetical protein
VPQFTEENYVRPMGMGRDSAKKLRAANSAASSTGCLEVLQKIHSDRAKYDARQEELVKDEPREIAERYERKLKIQEETMKIHSESVSIQAGGYSTANVGAARERAYGSSDDG